MEFHPSYARAADRASKVANNPPPASVASLAVPQPLAAGGFASVARLPPAPSTAPRLIDLERRVKFASP